MAKRNSRKTNDASTTRKEKAPRSSSTADSSVEHRVVAVAGQAGRIVGTVQARAEGWSDRDALRDRFASVRDKASKMVEHPGRRQEESSPRVSSPRGRSGGLVDAPGKRHRKPMPSRVATKHSDTRIAKMKVANESRRRGGGR